MIYRSKAPLRIGLAGGGTDVSPYCDQYGGAILNTTISLSAYADITPLPDDVIILEAADRNEVQHFAPGMALPIDGHLDLLKGVYNRILKDYGLPAGGFRLSTSVDAPAGSGLGTSSTLVVAVVGVFAEMLGLKLTPYAIAHYAYDIERCDLQWLGGRQDQYAATFGGFNYMEFYAGDEVVVTGLDIRPEYLYTLQQNLLLYYTDTSRESSGIIREQVKNVQDNKESSVAAMHHLKEQAQMMRVALLEGEPDDIGAILDYGFTQKRQMAVNISNDRIEALYAAAKKAGATGGKISGAGGGGFMIFYCPGNSRYVVSETLNNFGGIIRPYQFTGKGLHSWTEGS